MKDILLKAMLVLAIAANIAPPSTLAQHSASGWIHEPEVPIDFHPVGIFTPPETAVDTNGDVHLVWYDQGPDARTNSVVRYWNSVSRMSEDVAVGTQIYLKDNGGWDGLQVQWPAIDVDPTGKLHITYLSHESGAKNFSLQHVTRTVVLLVTISGINDHGNGMIALTRRLLSASNGASEVTICEAQREQVCDLVNPSEEEVRQKISQIAREATESGQVVIVNIDMDLENYSWELVLPESRWTGRSIPWAGRTANIVSEAFHLENPAGRRSLYAHSAGGDAARTSIEMSPGKRMYDDINILNGRTQADLLQRALVSGGYDSEWWRVKVFTSDGDLPAGTGSLSNPGTPSRSAGKSWVHVHSETITGHSGLRDNTESGEFTVNLGPIGRKTYLNTVDELMKKDWRWERGTPVWTVALVPSQVAMVARDGGIAKVEAGGFYARHSITIPKDALPRDMEITISEPADNHGIASAVEFGPSGLAFSKEVTITVEYKDSDVPQGYTAEALRLLALEGDEYVEVQGSVVNTLEKTVSGKVSHLSIYAAGVLDDSVAKLATTAEGPRIGESGDKFAPGNTRPRVSIERPLWHWIALGSSAIVVLAGSVVAWNHLSSRRRY